MSPKQEIVPIVSLEKASIYQEVYVDDIKHQFHQYLCLIQSDGTTKLDNGTMVVVNQKYSNMDPP